MRAPIGATPLMWKQWETTDAEELNEASKQADPHVTNGATASIWRVADVVLVLAGCGGCRRYCGACHWTVW
jgi:hypothetical protein